jgi:hypothetical protein
MLLKAVTRIALRAFVSAWFVALPVLAAAQDLEPRAYSPGPVGTNFVGLTYSRSSGDFLPDPTVPIQGASVHFNATTLGYYHSFGLFGRQASIALGVPYVWGSGSALVNGVPTHIYRSGLSDPVLRFSYIFYGSPAVTLQEFKKRRHRTIVGASVVVTAPLGQYDPRLLVNIGTNRWSIRPQVGFSREVHSWSFDAYLGGAFFTQNSNFFGGHVRDQAPIAAAQLHVSYTFRPGMWAAVDWTYYNGGRTTVDGRLNADLQQNTRVGLTFAVPIKRTQSLKFQYTRGAVVRVGGDFTTLSLSYQLRFMTRR